MLKTKEPILLKVCPHCGQDIPDNGVQTYCPQEPSPKKIKYSK